MTFTSKSNGKGRRLVADSKARVEVKVNNNTVVTFENEVNDFRAFDNTNSMLGAHAADTQTDLDNLVPAGVYKAVEHVDFTQDYTMQSYNEAGGVTPWFLGEFRIFGETSHFAYDDPIIHPGKPGRAHLHHFFGNQSIRANSTFNGYPGNVDAYDIFNNGMSTVQAYELNRSGYWMPALIDDVENIIIKPVNIYIYYKNSGAFQTSLMPPGLEMIAGNLDYNTGAVKQVNYDYAAEGKEWAYRAWWEGYNWHTSYNYYAQQSGIPVDLDQESGFHVDDRMRVKIKFPDRVELDVNDDPVLSSADHVSHTPYLTYDDWKNPEHDDQKQYAPAGYRIIPQITILAEFPYGYNITQGEADALGLSQTPGVGVGVENWRLSSDDIDDPSTYGHSLHADFWSGWNENANQAWIDGAFDPDTTSPFDNPGINNHDGPKNCPSGVTGSNSLWNSGTELGKQFKHVNNNTNRDQVTNLADCFLQNPNGSFMHVMY